MVEWLQRICAEHGLVGSHATAEQLIGGRMSRSTARAVGALIALALSTFAYVTTETLPIGLLLPIAEELGSTASAVGLLVTGYGLVVVLTSIPLTHLTRRVSRRLLI